jgi:nucleoside-diphosphate-sugar epimerase
MEGKKQVTITGVSGFLGAHVALCFLQDGTFKVRGTVRSTSNAAKIEPLKKAWGELFDQIELVEADLTDEPSMIKSCEGSSLVIHTASPFTFGIPEDQLVKPAVEGTLGAIKGAHANKAKVVLTSSLVAVCGGPDKDWYTPADWSDADKQSGYMKSKTLAEKAAWDYIAALPENEKFPLVTICPGFICGPNLNTATFTSGDMVGKTLKEAPTADGMVMSVVDVRDVAMAHLEAAKKDDANNQRFLLAEGRYC